MKPKSSLRFKGLLSLVILFIFVISTYGQVGIGTILPDSNSLLDIDSIDKGVLLPRVNLTSTASFAPLSAHVVGMIVYNQVSINDVTPGYYYNTGSAWVPLGEANDEWKLNGNASTSPGTNYLGTSDGVDLYMGTAGIERLRIVSDGRISVNGAPLFGVDRFTVLPAVGESGINSYATGGAAVWGEDNGGGDGVVAFANSTGRGIYGENTGTGLGVYGLSTSSGQGVRGFNNGSGFGVAGNNNSTGFGVIGFSSNTGVGVQGQNSSTGIGVVGIVSNASAEAVVAQNLNSSGVGIAGAANATYAILTGSGGTFIGTFGSTNFSSSSTGTGASGVGNNGNTVYTLTTGSGISGNGTTTGVYGLSTANSGVRQGGYFAMNKAGGVIPTQADDPFAVLAGYDGTDYFGGYFDGNQDNVALGGEDYAYVGITTGGTTYKIVGTGTNSTMVNDANGNKRILFSPEAPEILFEDYGSGQLVNGTVRITLDPLMSSIIHVSEDHPLRVFIQLEGNCKGVFVTNKSAEGFTVTELDQGNSNVPFSWHIVGNRADTVLDNGAVFSKHVDVRFPIGPNKISQKNIAAATATYNADINGEKRIENEGDDGNKKQNSKN